MEVAFKTPERTAEGIKITGTCTMSGERKRVAEIIDCYLNIVHGVVLACPGVTFSREDQSSVTQGADDYVTQRDFWIIFPLPLEAPIEVAVDPRKKQAEQAKKLYQVLNPALSRVCDRMKDALGPYGVIERWTGCAYTADELRAIGYDDFHVPSIGVRRIAEPGKEVAFLMFISDGSDWGKGSQLIFTTVTQWLELEFRTHSPDLHLTLKGSVSGDQVKIFLEKKISKEEQRLMYGDGRD